MSKEPEQTATTMPPPAPAAPPEGVTREQIVEDLRRTMADAKAYLEQLGAEGKEAARTRAAHTQDQMHEWSDQAEDMIRRKPLTSVAVALGIGYIIGKLGD